MFVYYLTACRRKGSSEDRKSQQLSLEYIYVCFKVNIFFLSSAFLLHECYPGASGYPLVS